MSDRQYRDEFRRAAATAPAALGVSLDAGNIRPAGEFASDGNGVECEQLPRDGSLFRVYRARDALVIGRPGVVGIRRGGRFVCFEESANYEPLVGPWLSSAIELVNSPNATGMEIRTACLLDGPFSDNYYHWMLDWLVKVVAMEEAGYSGPYLIPNAEARCAESLELLGIPRERVIEHDADFVLVDQLWFTQSTAGEFMYYQYPSLLHAMRQRLFERLPQHPRPRRLYIARRGTRSVVNEDDILPILDRYQFQIVYMEDYPLVEQLCMASQAEVIAGPHGAGLAHAAFMRQGGALVEMFSNEFIHPVMLAVCHALDHNYYMVVARKFPQGTFGNPEIEVDPLMLQLTLHNATRR